MLRCSETSSLRTTCPSAFLPPFIHRCSPAPTSRSGTAVFEDGWRITAARKKVEFGRLWFGLGTGKKGEGREEIVNIHRTRRIQHECLWSSASPVGEHKLCPSVNANTACCRPRLSVTHLFRVKPLRAARHAMCPKAY